MIRGSLLISQDVARTAWGLQITRIIMKINNVSLENVAEEILQVGVI